MAHSTHLGRTTGRTAVEYSIDTRPAVVKGGSKLKWPLVDGELDDGLLDFASSLSIRRIGRGAEAPCLGTRYVFHRLIITVPAFDGDD